MARLFFLLACACCFLTASCKQEGIGQVLFEVPFPFIEVAVPGGVTSTTTQVFSRDFVRTDFLRMMNETGVSPEDINVVGGLRARLVSLTAEDFSEMERITLRACAPGTENGCVDIRTQLFTVSDLFGRRQQTVRLNPTPINFKDFFLDNELIRLELTFQTGRTSNRNLECRLEWTLAAFAER